MVRFFILIKGGEIMTQTTGNEEVLNRKEASEMLKVPQRTLDYLVSTNQIPFSRVGRRSVRFTRSRLLEWLGEREGVEYRLTR
jgi:excisionase family DNA binding protein